MPKGRPKAARKLITTGTVEALLRSLQGDIERYGSEGVKQRRRALLKGFRAGFWSGLDKPTQAEVAQALRAELFGHALPVTAVSAEDDGCDPWLTVMEAGPTTCADLAHQTEESSDD